MHGSMRHHQITIIPDGLHFSCDAKRALKDETYCCSTRYMIGMHKFDSSRILFSRNEFLQILNHHDHANC